MPVPTLDELADFIEDPLRAKLEANQKIRRKNRRRNAIIMAVVCLLFLPAAIGATIWHGSYGNEFLGGASSVSIPIVLALVFAFLYMPIRLRYSSEEIPFEYPPDVVAPVVQFIDPRLTYGEEKGVEANDIVEGGVLSATPDRFVSSHLFEGSLRSARLRLAYVEAQTTSKKMLRRVVGDEFCGLFAAARFDEEFAGTTVVAPRRGDDTVPGEEFQTVEVDIGEFEERFQCRSTAAETWAELISTPLAERITALDEAFSAKDSDDEPRWKIVFRGDRLFFAHPEQDYFDRAAPRFSVDTAHLHRVGRQIRAVVDLVEFVEAARPD